MTGRQEYAYGTGDGTVHNGVALKYTDDYNGRTYTITVDHEDRELSGTAVFKNKLGNEGYNK